MGIKKAILGILLVLFYNALLVIAVVEAAALPWYWTLVFAAPMVALGVYADIKVIRFIKNNKDELWKK